jgi:hypothetical protein
MYTFRCQNFELASSNHQIFQYDPHFVSMIMPNDSELGFELKQAVIADEDYVLSLVWGQTN